MMLKVLLGGVAMRLFNREDLHGMVCVSLEEFSMFNAIRGLCRTVLAQGRGLYLPVRL